MTSALEKLKKEKAMLLKQRGMNSANLVSLRQRRAEEEKLKAEIRMLKNPAKEKVKADLKSAFRKFGHAVGKAATATGKVAATVARNAERMEKERKARSRQDEMIEKRLQLARLNKRKSVKKKPKRKTTKKKKSVRRKRK